MMLGVVIQTDGLQQIEAGSGQLMVQCSAVDIKMWTASGAVVDI